MTEAYSRARASSARASDSGGGWISVKRRLSWDDWGTWEERAVYSAEMIRQARILPDLLWARSVRGLPGTWRRGRGGWVAHAGHARPIRRVVLTPTRNGGHLRATRLFVRRAMPDLYFNRVPSLPATDDGSGRPLTEDLSTGSDDGEDITWDADTAGAGEVPAAAGPDTGPGSVRAEPARRRSRCRAWRQAQGGRPGTGGRPATSATASGNGNEHAASDRTPRLRSASRAGGSGRPRPRRYVPIPPEEQDDSAGRTRTWAAAAIRRRRRRQACRMRRRAQKSARRRRLGETRRTRHRLSRTPEPTPEPSRRRSLSRRRRPGQAGAGADGGGGGIAGASARPGRRERARPAC